MARTCLQALDRREDPLAELGVRLHDRSAPAFVSGPGFREDRRGDADLADVVEERAELEALQRVGVEAELAADVEGHVGDPAGVGRGVLVVRLESVRERLDGGEERLARGSRSARVLDRELRLVRDAGEEAHRPRSSKRLSRPSRTTMQPTRAPSKSERRDRDTAAPSSGVTPSMAES